MLTENVVIWYLNRGTGLSTTANSGQKVTQLYTRGFRERAPTTNDGLAGMISSRNYREDRSLSQTCDKNMVVSSGRIIRGHRPPNPEQSKLHPMWYFLSLPPSVTFRGYTILIESWRLSLPVASSSQHSLGLCYVSLSNTRKVHTCRYQTPEKSTRVAFRHQRPSQEQFHYSTLNCKSGTVSPWFVTNVNVCNYTTVSSWRNKLRQSNRCSKIGYRHNTSTSGVQFTYMLLAYPSVM